MRALLLLPVLLLHLFVAPAYAGDIFPGTLEIRDGKPLLIRCDLVKNTYLLVDKDGNVDVWLKQIEKLGITPENPYQATVLGDARMEGNTVILTVDSIEDIKPGSCHLGDLFK